MTALKHDMKIICGSLKQRAQEVYQFFQTPVIGFPFASPELGR
jgi:hypothetical protein